MIVRIYTGHDGQTHFEDLPLPAEESHNVALQAGANLVFRCFPADYWSDWHTAPRRQYIFILVGQMEIGIGDGTTRRFGPGDVVLADDLTGQGHLRKPPLKPSGRVRIPLNKQPRPLAERNQCVLSAVDPLQRGPCNPHPTRVFNLRA
jgi:hypothetical protein